MPSTTPYLLVYLDEAYIYQDLGLGHGGSERGRRSWIASRSPRSSDKLPFYGLYLYNEGAVRPWPYARANGEHTFNVLHSFAWRECGCCSGGARAITPCRVGRRPL